MNEYDLKVSLFNSGSIIIKRNIKIRLLIIIYNRSVKKIWNFNWIVLM